MFSANFTRVIKQMRWFYHGFDYFLILEEATVLAFGGLLRELLLQGRRVVLAVFRLAEHGHVLVRIGALAAAFTLFGVLHRDSRLVGF